MFVHLTLADAACSFVMAILKVTQGGAKLGAAQLGHPARLRCVCAFTKTEKQRVGLAG